MPKYQVLRGIRDSKKLTTKQRKVWHRVLTNHPKIKWATAVLSHRTIDRINIARAADLGAYRVYKKISGRKIPLLSFSYDRKKMIVNRKKRIRAINFVLLDGGLKLPSHISHEAIIKGDEKIPAISAASIIAKVTRDRIMARLHKKYPKYGFDVHKGYGTEFHREMIKKIGRCEVHRKSFRA